MGIKCSLFGHAFGETSVERDREEQGSEVVITIRELQTCTRCGERRVVSENKEVTTLETPDDIEVDDEPAESVDHSSVAPTIDDAEADAETTGADVESAGIESTDVEPADEQAQAADSASDPVDAETVDGEAIDEEPPVTDDAEILDDEDDEDEPEREPGQWPQEADEGDDEHEEPTDAAFNQFGYDDTEETVDDEKTDAEFIDSDDEPAESAPQPQTNEWPSEEEIDAASEPESAGPGAVTVPEGSFVCEGCGFSTPVESSSLREGDFCPECHKETLVQVRGE